MRRRSKAGKTEAKCVSVTATAAPATRADQQGAEASPIPLVRLAQELGRLLARHALAEIRNRRGYGLPEILLGTLVTVLLWVLVVRVLGLLPH